MMEQNNLSNSWYPLEENFNDTDPSVIDASSWLDKPAGKHGWLQSKDDKFVFEDGTPIVFWGSNVTESHVHDKSRIDLFVNRAAKYGLNALRFHKFTWPASGVVLKDGPTTELDPLKMDGMDKFFFEAKQRGIYITWSHIFGHMVSEADNLKSGFIGMKYFSEAENSYGIVNFAEDLQDLVIRLTTNLLNHYNPYTGLRYADDTALAVIELQNEDNIFFCANSRADSNPFYRKLLNALFSKWLKDKYFTEEALKKAWGKDALEPGESLEKGNIYANINCWVMDNESLKQNSRMQKRLLDSARFAYETQIKYYNRYREALRATGYKGVILGSPWMAGRGIPHYYNLHSDALVGPIDRHAYWGGGEGHMLSPGKFQYNSMLEKPGSGLLRLGLEKALNRPFMMSEWNSTPPNQWLTEAPFLISVYGLGLQGWSASFSYALDHLFNIYNVNIPTHLAQYPALARMIYRGDVKPGDFVYLQDVDIDKFTDSPYAPQSIESELMAVGRVAVNFTDMNKDCITVKRNIEDYWNKDEKTITSTTGQLTWNYKKSQVKINTPGTQGILGFTLQEPVELDDVIITTWANPFVNITLTSLNEYSIKDSRSLLITALARCKNTGMEYSDDGTELVKTGQKPMLMESVHATFHLKKTGSVKVHVLNQHGQRTGAEIPVKKVDDGIFFCIDGNSCGFWFEIEVIDH